MSSDAMQTVEAPQVERGAAGTAVPLRVWPAVALVGLYWVSWFVLRAVEPPMFVRFVSSLAACAVLTLLFTLWWWLNGRIRLADRLVGFAVAVAGGAGAALLSPTKVGMVAWLLLSVPAWVAWLLVARAAAPVRRLGLVVVLGLSWGAFLLIRMDGLSGDGETVLRWRWAPIAEQLYLAERARDQGGDPAAPPASPVENVSEASSGDWPGFRGPGRDGVVRGVSIATDWNAAPPRQVWRRRVGPAWSSLAVVGGRLFTQEQRGEHEAVVCLDATTGREIWSHEDAVRFWDAQAGAGPRATPTFAHGRLFALGATGVLNCLDAASGKQKWSRDIAADSGAKAPMWGFASSPLVVGKVVIVFAGGDGDRGLLAYRVDSGEPAWTAAAGKSSYSSPQLVSLAGEDQVLFFGDRGLVAVAPDTGTLLWEFGAPGKGMPRSVQPRQIDHSHVLLGSEADFGMALIGIDGKGPKRLPQQRWASRQMKPSFNDFVVLAGGVYGFDNNIFCCLDAKTGALRWKKGRYGHGQVLLLADQRLLLVVSERGQAILVRPGERPEELGRFQAVNGKTWNHPVVAHGRLYVRNAEEMACYDLAPSRSAPAGDGR
jgi:outer membrane protein assembly factor BamB